MYSRKFVLIVKYTQWFKNRIYVVIYKVINVIGTKFYKKDVFLWMKKKNEIILFENQGVKLEVNLKDYMLKGYAVNQKKD